MKTSLEIINKLSEKEAVKLESEKVELAVLLPLEQTKKRRVDMETSIKSLVKKIQDVKKEASEIANSSKLMRNIHVQNLKEAEKKAQELSIPLPKEWYNEVDLMEKAIKSIPTI